MENISNINNINNYNASEKRSDWKGRLWDGHIHLFPPRLFRAIYRVFREDYRWNLAFADYHPALISYLKSSGIYRASVLVYAHKPNISLELNRWLANLVHEYPWLVPYGCIHPDDDNLENTLHETLDILNFPGIKIHCLVKNIRPDDERLFPVYEALTKRGKAVIIHASTFPLHITSMGIKYIYNILRRFPTLRILIPHMGLFEVNEYACLLDEYPQVYLDTAFVFNNNGFPIKIREIKEMIIRFPDRIIYGSDFPFIVNEPSVDIKNILSLKLPPEVLSTLFYENAKSFAEQKTP